MYPEQPSVQCQNWLSGFLKAVISPRHQDGSRHQVSAPGLGTRTGLGQTRSLRQCQALAEPLLAHLLQTIVWQLKT